MNWPTINWFGNRTQRYHYDRSAGACPQQKNNCLHRVNTQLSLVTVHGAVINIARLAAAPQ